MVSCLKKTFHMMKKATFNHHKTPEEIVKEMDKYIVGQQDAKKAVAIAFVNRGRRMMIKDDALRAEIMPKNVLLYGPTGVGKTEIARRVADITDSPFLKVEMTKFTEVGYAGKDVESIIRDLVSITIKREKDRLSKEREIVSKKQALKVVAKVLADTGVVVDEDKLANGYYDNEEIKIDLPEGYGMEKDGGFDEFGAGGFGMGTAIISVIPVFGAFSDEHGERKARKTTKTVKVRQALEKLADYDLNEYVGKHLIIPDVLKKIEQKGVIFLDEIDKLISNKESHSRGEVSREGVQRDLLPIIEGTMVQTKYGSLRTDHILFIAAGAFHDNKVSDLMPELQGRFPICVPLKSLSVKDFEHILSDLKYSLPEQQQQLLKVDGISVVFEKSGLKEIAEVSYRMNSELENTGARRLHSVIEKVVEEMSYSGKKGAKVAVDKAYVVKMTKDAFDKKVNVKKYVI